MAGVGWEALGPEIQDRRQVAEQGGKPGQRHNWTYNSGHSVWLLGRDRSSKSRNEFMQRPGGSSRGLGPGGSKGA